MNNKNNKTNNEKPEHLEDAEDIRLLKKMGKKELHFTKLEDFLREYNPSPDTNDA